MICSVLGTLVKICGCMCELLVLIIRYASICAMESTSKLDDGQWLAYWIIYSFIALFEMAAEQVLYWIPLWYEVKLLFVAWLVLPQFRGASFIYEKFVREQIRKHGLMLHEHHGHDAGHGSHVLKAEHGVH
uniref:HVA22-like protein n=1 Tax=Triticum urartu TaxID=4572 RepID=A0A8R7UJE5_TRIUA